MLVCSVYNLMIKFHPNEPSEFTLKLHHPVFTRYVIFRVSIEMDCDIFIRHIAQAPVVADYTD